VKYLGISTGKCFINNAGCLVASSPSLRDVHDGLFIGSVKINKYAYKIVIVKFLQSLSLWKEDN
jgi:hypothetical protein